MTPYETYQLFLAIKMHFTQPSYDFFKYNGKVRTDHRAFERRRDKYQFFKLSKHRDPLGYLVANFAAGNSGKWIGDFLTDSSERVYDEWLARQQSITYRFKSDLVQFQDDFREIFRVSHGQHPQLLTSFKRGDVTIETLTILNNLLTFFPTWDKKIEDTILWPSIRDRCLKYAPFIKYDKQKLKQIVKDLL
jgi:T4 gene Gp59 loader of gp41 DNA helicase/T4 gene Gp59 loader of gp41 DNA helicase C-term